MRALVLSWMVLVAGCGAAEYRIVRSVHEVTLTEEVALGPIRGDHDSAILASMDLAFARGLEAAAPAHRFSRAAVDPPFTLSVALSRCEAREGRTALASSVTVADARSRVVDEIEISFEQPGDCAAAGEELGLRVGHYLSHRDGYHL